MEGPLGPSKQPSALQLLQGSQIHTDAENGSPNLVLLAHPTAGWAHVRDACRGHGAGPPYGQKEQDSGAGRTLGQGMCVWARRGCPMREKLNHTQHSAEHPPFSCPGGGNIQDSVLKSTSQVNSFNELEGSAVKLNATIPVSCSPISQLPQHFFNLKPCPKYVGLSASKRRGDMGIEVCGALQPPPLHRAILFSSHRPQNPL